DAADNGGEPRRHPSDQLEPDPRAAGRGDRELQHQRLADPPGRGGDVEILLHQRSVEADLHLARAGGEAGLDEVEPEGVGAVRHRQSVRQRAGAAGGAAVGVVDRRRRGVDYAGQRDGPASRAGRAAGGIAVGGEAGKTWKLSSPPWSAPPEYPRRLSGPSKSTNIGSAPDECRSCTSARQSTSVRTAPPPNVATRARGPLPLMRVL